MGMARAGVTILLSAVIGAWVGLQAKRVGADEAVVQHHVVGGDRGWEPSSDVVSWASGRDFRVGDKLWFAYSAAQEGLVELKSMEEYESCDLANPIRMYTDGIVGVPLDGVGIRYFASSRPESCRSGLKLHVDVQPQTPRRPAGIASVVDAVGVAAADGPIPPSAANGLRGTSVLLLTGLALCLVTV